MAKKKIDKEAVEPEVTKTTVQEETKPTVDAAPETKEQEKTATVELEKHVDELLKCYPEYKELYIDRLGGVYTKESQPCIRKGAILYQNPYYNK